VNSAKNHQPFPAVLPWEEFTEYRVSIGELRERAPSHNNAMMVSLIAGHFTPVLLVNAVQKLIAESDTNLRKAAASKLDVDLRAICLWYLMPAARAAADADLNVTRRYLGKLTRLSKDIVPSLLHVFALLSVSVSEKLGQIPEWKESGHAGAGN